MNVLHQAMGSGAWSNTFDEDGRLVAVEWSNAFRRFSGLKMKKIFRIVSVFFRKSSSG